MLQGDPGEKGMKGRKGSKGVKGNEGPKVIIRFFPPLSREI